MSILSGDSLNSLVYSFHKRGYYLCDPSIATSETDSSSGSSGDSGSFRTLHYSSTSFLSLRDPKHSQSVVHIAVRKGDLEVLDAVLHLNKGPSLVNAPDSNGNVPLHFAVARNIPHGRDSLKKLLSAGANINAVNYKGLTPISVHILTLESDKLTILEMLLENGANPNDGVYGSTLLHYAVHRGFHNVACKLLSSGALLTQENAYGVMACEMVSHGQLIRMLNHIRYRPQFVKLDTRNSCMMCNSGPFQDIRKQKKGLLKWLQKAFRGDKLIQYHNCFHCGRILCDHCVVKSTGDEVLPSSFERGIGIDSDSGLHKPSFICNTCSKVMSVRKQKNKNRIMFVRRSMGCESKRR